jgi:hypothetical protein
VTKPWEEEWTVGRRPSGTLCLQIAPGGSFIDDEARLTLAKASPDLYRALEELAVAVVNGRNEGSALEQAKAALRKARVET